MRVRSPRAFAKLSAKELIVLELLVSSDGMYGLELVAASDGALKRGTVYVTLGRMEDKGYIESRQEDAPASVGGLPRRVYEPTALGRQLCGAWKTIRRQLSPRFSR
jgi:DNA-binding PadR family transcriptional regulator